MAVGCSDGMIRFLRDFGVVKILPRGPHTKAITHLISFDSANKLLSASADGAICVWDVSGPDSLLVRLNGTRGAPHESG
jgi:WD40 repeat protein